MNSIIKTRNLLAPPYCESVETFICPIPVSDYDSQRSFKIAGGWKFFNDLRVIQKNNNSFIEVHMPTKELLNSAKINSKFCYNAAELHLENIINERVNFAKLDMSKPHIMGIINVTPDSFYKNSQITDSNKLNKVLYEMINNGASIIDVGGESSRPGAERISVVEEKNRVIKSIKHIKNCKVKSMISLDSQNLSTMKTCHKIGINIFNDITAFKDKKKVEFISKISAPIIIMHMQKKPINMQNNPKYNFAPVDIYKFFSKKISNLIKSGVKKSNIVIDPGIGFGKTLSDNLNILKYLPIYHTLGVPILIGVSRKSLIGEITTNDFEFRRKNKNSVKPSKRLSGSIAFAIHANMCGVQIIRTHDVFETNQALICLKSINL